VKLSSQWSSRSNHVAAPSFLTFGGCFPSAASELRVADGLVGIWRSSARLSARVIDVASDHSNYAGMPRNSAGDWATSELKSGNAKCQGHAP
jgi:hypothetical protein